MDLEVINIYNAKKANLTEEQTLKRVIRIVKSIESVIGSYEAIEAPTVTITQNTINIIRDRVRLLRGIYKSLRRGSTHLKNIVDDYITEYRAIASDMHIKRIINSK